MQWAPSSELQLQSSSNLHRWASTYSLQAPSVEPQAPSKCPGGCLLALESRPLVGGSKALAAGAPATPRGVDRTGPSQPKENPDWPYQRPPSITGDQRRGQLRLRLLVAGAGKGPAGDMCSADSTAHGPKAEASSRLHVLSL